MSENEYSKAAVRGEPSYIWRAGQIRRLEMIKSILPQDRKAALLVNGCGVGTYLQRLGEFSDPAVGLDIDFERTVDSRKKSEYIVNAAGETLPFADEQYDIVITNEVIEHVVDDRLAIQEMVRCLKPGGRIVLFCPNRGYPFETHGLYWKGKYHFGNKLFVNYLPNSWRNKLAPHVRVYTRRDLEKLFVGLPVKYVTRTVIFGGYDNIIARYPALGKALRGFLYTIEKTFLRVFGLSHFWIVEKL
ncbi:MAG: class I SAM-dependent methyltransferase [Anaerolineaceae bacterium]|nr:class I SAM-dependent methyltransferase [Anaerolineaceae bacterium]